MVKILQALKITLFYFVPLTVSMAAMLLSVLLADFHQVSGGIAFSNEPIPVLALLGIFVGAAIIFIFFLFKGVGDITEAALIE
ncbi:MAG: hypothetical protein ACTSVO_02495 [Candidatus Heimdallarchaeaceae archaeon]